MGSLRSSRMSSTMGPLQEYSVLGPIARGSSHYGPSLASLSELYGYEGEYLRACRSCGLSRGSRRASYTASRATCRRLGRVEGGWTRTSGSTHGWTSTVSERRDAETDMMIDYARRSRMSSRTASQVMLASQVMQPSRPASYQASWIEHSGASTLGEEMPGTRPARAAPRGTQYSFSARSHLDPPRAFLPEIPSPRSKTEDAPPSLRMSRVTSRPSAKASACTRRESVHASAVVLWFQA